LQTRLRSLDRLVSQPYHNRQVLVRTLSCSTVQ
jgi:hypothetical protein